MLPICRVHIDFILSVRKFLAFLKFLSYSRSLALSLPALIPWWCWWLLLLSDVHFSYYTVLNYVCEANFRLFYVFSRHSFHQHVIFVPVSFSFLSPFTFTLSQPQFRLPPPFFSIYLFIFEIFFISLAYVGTSMNSLGIKKEKNERTTTSTPKRWILDKVRQCYHIMRFISFCSVFFLLFLRKIISFFFSVPLSLFFFSSPFHFIFEKWIECYEFFLHAQAILLIQYVFI